MASHGVGQVSRMPLPAWGDRAKYSDLVVSDLLQFASDATFRGFLAELGGRSLPQDNHEVLAISSELAGLHDLRRGTERDGIVVSESISIPRFLDAFGERLGMYEDHLPELEHYDHLLILGGTATSNRLRVAWALKLLASVVSAGSITLLGTSRPLSDRERELERTHWREPHANEYAVLCEMLENHAAVAKVNEKITGTGRSLQAITEWRSTKYGSIQSLCAPSSQPSERRANTGDCLSTWARITNPKENERILLVTTSIYASYQHFTAVRELGLPFQCSIFTIGNTFNSDVNITYHAGNYLQEAFANCDSAWQLLKAALQENPLSARERDT